MRSKIAWKLMGVRMRWVGGEDGHYRRDWRWFVYRSGARLMDTT